MRERSRIQLRRIVEIPRSPRMAVLRIGRTEPGKMRVGDLRKKPLTALWRAPDPTSCAIQQIEEPRGQRNGHRQCNNPGQHDAADHTMLEAGFFLLTQNHGACNSRSDYILVLTGKPLIPAAPISPAATSSLAAPFIGVRCVRPGRSPNMCTIRL
jgi:hypothetical protein